MKKIHTGVIAAGLILMFFLANCSFEKLDRAIKMGSKGLDPKWDLDAAIPVLEKRIYLKDYMKNVSIDPYETTGTNPLVRWPVDTAETDVFSGTVPVDIKVDFNPDDGVDNDLKIFGIYSKEANCFIDVWLTEQGQTQCLAINKNDINFVSVKIEGHVYGGSYYSNDNNIVTYMLDDFPAADKGYFIDFAGDDSKNTDVCNFDDLTVLLNPGPAVYAGSTYIIHIRARVTLGDNFGVSAMIISNSELLNKKDISLPIKDLPFDDVHKFRIEYNIESTFPFSINMANHIKTRDNSLTQDASFLINSGNLKYLPANDYCYVAEEGYTGSAVNINPVFFDKSGVSMDYSVSAVPTGGKILLTTGDEMLIKADIKCSGEM